MGRRKGSAAKYVYENGCVPISSIKAKFLDDLFTVAADSRYSSEALGIRVRNFLTAINNATPAR